MDNDPNDGLSDFNPVTGYDIKVDGTTIVRNNDQLEIPDSAINSAKIEDASITADDIQPNAISIDLLEDDSVGTDELINAAVTPVKLEPGGANEMLVTIGGNVSWEPISNYSADDNQYAVEVDFDPGDTGIDVNGDGTPETNVRQAIINLSAALALDDDTSATNEIQDISTDGNPGNISIASGATLDLNINDGDFDDQNELISAFDFDDGTNILSITEAGVTRTVDFTGTDVSAKNGSSDTKNIRRVSDNKAAVDASDHTLILEDTVSQLNLPGATTSNTGQIYVLKDLGGAITTLNIPYRDETNNLKNTTINGGIIWLQSDGTEWQLIK